jgi:hypothetical protein
VRVRSLRQRLGRTLSTMGVTRVFSGWRRRVSGDDVGGVLVGGYACSVGLTHPCQSAEAP